MPELKQVLETDAAYIQEAEKISGAVDQATAQSGMVNVRCEFDPGEEEQLISVGVVGIKPDAEDLPRVLEIYTFLTITEVDQLIEMLHKAKAHLNK